ncbi:hypothetical protein LAZ67_22000430 [Cordylochernes scorpioides]|uniref:Transposase n=1 Tax=Cordylochernes scorpioides TaxID=51811 RepID=A0ABY6LS52_9ARAC|nr:hypothetical protein LAZ67_22000430 [Cordylochernes scorpioides]
MNSDLYCDILVNKLKPGIRNKRRGELSKGFLFLHDNARPHTSCKTVSTIIKLGFEVLEHPAYSPIVVLSDYFLFGLLKKELKGKRFDSDEDVQKVVQDFFHTLPKSAYKEGIYKLPERWRRCIESQDFLNNGQTITGNYYANFVKQLRESIKEKRRGMLYRKIVYHQDNAPSHRSLQAMAAIYDFGFELSPHAPYSPDLAPGVVHQEFLPQGRTVDKEYYLQVMRNLREAIRQKRPDLWKNKNWLLHHDNAPAHTSLLRLVKGRPYATFEEIKTASKEELKKILKNEFLKCFEDWKNRWHKCIISHGDYFEGDKIGIHE